MGQPNGDEERSQPAGGGALRPLADRRRHRKADDDLWQVASPIRRLVHLFAAFHADVAKEVPTDTSIRESFGAWWQVVEERDWREFESDLEWVAEFVKPLLFQMRKRSGRSTIPPMVKILQEMAAKRLPFSEPSLAFRRYHMKRPDVYERFKQVAEEKLNAGLTRYSALRILDDLRAAGVKHSADNLSPEYARKLVGEDARFAHFFILAATRKGQEKRHKHIEQSDADSE